MKNRAYVWLLLVVVLCLAGWTVNAQLQKSQSARQIWEYKNMVFVVDTFGRQTFFEDGRQVPGAVPLTKISEVGVQGWELVSVTSTSTDSTSGSTTTNVYWLKRPR